MRPFGLGKAWAELGLGWAWHLREKVCTLLPRFCFLLLALAVELGARVTGDQPSLFSWLMHKRICGGHPNHVISLPWNNRDSPWLFAFQAALRVCSQFCSFTRELKLVHTSHWIALAQYWNINQGEIGVSTEELQCLICTCYMELFCQMTPVNYLLFNSENKSSNVWSVGSEGI